MPVKKTTDDSQKIRLIPELISGVAALHKLIVTGDVERGEPGLLENIRHIKEDISDIKNKQINYEELERRVREIEARHKRIDEEAKKADTYKLAMFGVLFSNVVMIVLWFLGFNK